MLRSRWQAKHSRNTTGYVLYEHTYKDLIIVYNAQHLIGTPPPQTRISTTPDTMIDERVVWCMGDPDCWNHFHDRTLMCNCYLQLLQNIVCAWYEELPLRNAYGVWFQHDVAPYIKHPCIYNNRIRSTDYWILRPGRVATALGGLESHGLLPLRLHQGIDWAYFFYLIQLDLKKWIIFACSAVLQRVSTWYCHITVHCHHWRIFWAVSLVDLIHSFLWYIDRFLIYNKFIFIFLFDFSISLFAFFMIPKSQLQY